MKILGIVTLVSPLGEYGGPTRVAINQLLALQQRGHQVVLAGTQRGFDGNVPTELDGVPARLFPARTILPGSGFAGLGSPELWRAVHRHAREFDVVHVHAARDLVTLPSALIAVLRGVPIVVQTHGMIDETNNPLAVPLDLALTRPVLHRARIVAYLTARERASLQVVAGGEMRLEELPNGVPLQASARIGGPARVLYLARLAARKLPVAFVEAAARVAPAFPEATFALVGPDEGEGPAVRDAIAASGHGDRIRWEGPIGMSGTAERMRHATVYVLPSVDEPYPMSVLEAMSVGLPVIITDTCGLASFVTQHEAGLVTDGTVESLEEALRTLLADPDRSAAMGARGRNAVRSERSMTAIAQRLEAFYS
ncbi:glycosyltransferase [Microbacterium trichothecenolyticum]|uniref:glycosyltransferase n=1 Tax=Microbacterium trichothecenolyticum TaxID=69370 RepID=UPI001C6F2361|nr:glycosyltransferase [Microbacterium trichothecenolyticum]MBW9121135.1 glycosyltransferase [Microbacterium trichothecenolyticum]